MTKINNKGINLIILIITNNLTVNPKNGGSPAKLKILKIKEVFSGWVNVDLFN